MAVLKRHCWLVGMALAVLATVVAVAGVESYRQIKTAPTQLRGGAIDGADSLDWSSPIDTTGSDRSVFACRGNTTGAISPRLSVSGATVGVSVGLYHLVGSTYTYMGVATVQTATGSDDVDSNGEFISKNTIFFDTAGATHFEVRKTDPSDSSTVRFFAWLYPSSPVGAND